MRRAGNEKPTEGQHGFYDPSCTTNLNRRPRHAGNGLLTARARPSDVLQARILLFPDSAGLRETVVS